MKTFLQREPTGKDKALLGRGKEGNISLEDHKQYAHSPTRTCCYLYLLREKA